MWVRWRCKWNTGPSEEWDWIYTKNTDIKSLELEIIELYVNEEYKYLDGYRGVEVEIADPPTEWFDKEISNLERKINNLNEYIEFLRANR